MACSVSATPLLTFGLWGGSLSSAAFVVRFLPFRCATLSATLAQDGSKKHNVKSIENGNANCTPAKSQKGMARCKRRHPFLS